MPSSNQQRATSQPVNAQRPRTLSVGGATFDLFVFCDHTVIKQAGRTSAFSLPLGAKVPVQKIVGACGGGASNTSVGLQRLGCDAMFVGVVGDDQWGQALLKNLEAEGVRTENVTVIEEETSSFSIVFTTETGERVIIYDAGTNEHLHDVTFPKDALSNVDWVYLNHLHERSCVIQDELVAMLTAPGSPKLTWNPGGCQIKMGMNHILHRTLLAHTEVLLLNKEEALEFTGKTAADDALRACREAGARNVCITDGKNGAIAADGKQIYQCPVAQAAVVDTTGAGDAFGTALTWAILSGFDLPTALKAATINGASVVSAIGAQTGLLTETDMITKLRELDLNVMARAL